MITTAKAAQAASILDVSLEGLTSDMLGSAYRVKAKACHPDHHGQSCMEQWSRVSWANECLKLWLARPQTYTAPPTLPKGPDCLRCGGTGRIAMKRRGFGAPTTMACVNCRGVGSVEPEENDID